MSTLIRDGIVFVPPVGSRPALWSHVIESLDPSRPTLLWDRHIDPQNLVDDLEGLADQLLDEVDAAGLTNPIGVGISMGAMVLQYAAARSPQRFGGLLLGNTNYRQGPESRVALGLRAARAEESPSDYLDELVARWFSKGFHEQFPERVDQVRENLATVPPTAHSADWRAITGLDTAELLTQIDCPTIVIASTGDDSTPPRTQNEIAQAIPGAELVVIDDAGHMSCVERPDVWTQCINRLSPNGRAEQEQNPKRDEGKI